MRCLTQQEKCHSKEDSLLNVALTDKKHHEILLSTVNGKSLQD